jgi:glutamate 5-kinase
MRTKNLKVCLHGGVEKHFDGSFTMYAHIENKDDEEVGTHHVRYMDYTLSQAKQRFKSELEDLLELLEEYEVFTNDDWIIFDYPHKVKA